MTEDHKNGAKRPALHHWQEQVRKCGCRQKELDQDRWCRLSGWYDNWVQHNDYVQKVLPRLVRHLQPTSRVLEIGSGTGGFTLPLASCTREIVALEPSAGMRQVLTRELSRAGRTNVLLVPQRAEDGLKDVKGPFDVALASHALFDVTPIGMVLVELTKLADYTYILIGTGDRSDWYRDLRQRFSEEEGPTIPNFGHLYSVMLEMGIWADVEILLTSSNYVYDTEEALVTWWMKHLQLGESRRNELERSLHQVIEYRGDCIGIYGWHRTALICIDRSRNLFLSP